MHGPYRRYIINLKSKAPTGDEMHIVYQNKELVTSGHGGYEGPQRGDWEVLVSPGPWWDGTKPQFIVTDSITPPMSQGAIFRKLADRYDLDQIWTVDVRDSWRPGSVVWVQRADAPNPNLWHVWHTPITDKGKVLQTAPNDWSDCGWYDDVASAPVDQHQNFSFPRAQPTHGWRPMRAHPQLMLWMELNPGHTHNSLDRLHQRFSLDRLHQRYLLGHASSHGSTHSSMPPLVDSSSDDLRLSTASTRYSSEGSSSAAS